ncbi:fumarylacetoacetate hydrolase family protein [Paenibacillus sp. IB182496]|uniref:Fumarylacetoacetate hydrolase family protein n=1 Tax=Paenibacillus sabuli TaxID=2772509 RepID=A0A927GS39_9BACL|nr:fumarylacetoacetate hydrolase family protein [Paenibacillus sabuli]MBD2846314.1 fumarylacetoacetate hydrolase family protein [Paenibacillus sabuli]
MKYMRYRLDGRVAYGVLDGEAVHPVEGSIFGPHEVSPQTIPLAGVELLAPVAPGKMIAIGLNYKQHAAEVGKPLPEEPLLFLVSPTAVIGPGETIELQTPAHRIEHEGELAVVIGKRAYRVDEAEALDYVCGYTCCNDVSDRVLQRRDGQFARAKSYPTYKPLGPVIATGLQPDRTRVRVRVGGELRQDGATSDMICGVAGLIAFVSRVMPLEPGDVLLTGTPSGVAPLVAGDTVEVEIDGIGVLANPVAAAAAGGVPGGAA